MLEQEPVEVEIIPKTENANFGDFTHELPGNEADHSLEMNEFGGFSDPIVDLDLSGFHGVSADGAGEHERQWVELTKLMGNVSEGQNSLKSEQYPIPTPMGCELAMPVLADEEAIKETEDTSIAPTMAEAVIESIDDSLAKPARPSSDGADVREVAFTAEGSLAVPLNLEGHLIEGEPSDIPTEEVNELPPADAPMVLDDLPLVSADQLEAKAPIVAETVGDGDFGLKFTGSTQSAAGVRARADASFIEGLDESLTAEPHAGTGFLPVSSLVDSINTDPSAFYETPALSVKMEPEAIHPKEITSPLALASTEVTGDVTAAPATANGVEEGLQEQGGVVHAETPASTEYREDFVLTLFERVA